MIFGKIKSWLSETILASHSDNSGCINQSYPNHDSNKCLEDSIGQNVVKKKGLCFKTNCIGQIQANRTDKFGSISYLHIAPIIKVGKTL